MDYLFRMQPGQGRPQPKPLDLSVDPDPDSVRRITPFDTALGPLAREAVRNMPYEVNVAQAVREFEIARRRAFWPNPPPFNLPPLTDVATDYALAKGIRERAYGKVVD